MNKLINIKNKQKGFTLVELLVVVAIIAILSTIGLVIFSTAQGGARDARRKNDVDAIAKALESTRTAGAPSYTSLPNGSFSAGTVPVDNAGAASKPQYCIITGSSPIASTVPNPATSGGDAWAITTQCPTGWTAIPAAGIAAGTAPFATAQSYWKVCSRLEAVTPATGQSYVVYCKNSAQ